MKNLCLNLLFLFSLSFLSSQNNFKVIVEGLKVGDSATIILQKGAEKAKKVADSTLNRVRKNLGYNS